MNAVSSEKEILKYWPFQHFGLALLALLSLGITLFLLSAALAQQSLLGLILTLCAAFMTAYWAGMQYLVWKTQASTITVMKTGISGKPFLGRDSQVSWGDLTEVVTSNNRFWVWSLPQIEIRGRAGKSLRISFMFPKLKRLLQLIGTRSPQARIEIKLPKFLETITTGTNSGDRISDSGDTNPFPRP